MLNLKHFFLFPQTLYTSFSLVSNSSRSIKIENSRIITNHVHNSEKYGALPSVLCQVEIIFNEASRKIITVAEKQMFLRI